MSRIPHKIAGLGASDIPDAASFDAYIGPAREITVDQQRGIIALHNGTTPGGYQFRKAEIASAQLRKNNFTTSRAPLPTDDETQGYEVGSRWLWQGQEWFRSVAGWVKVKTPQLEGRGAKGDGVADDTSAVRQAGASGLVETEMGKVYKTDITNFTQVPFDITGRGQVETVAGRMPPEFRRITGRPSKLGGPAWLQSAFDGDFSKVGSAFGYVVSGDALGQPTSYLFTPETSVHFSWVRMESGWGGPVGGGSDLGGRTGYTTNRHIIEMRGQGDAIVHNSTVNVHTGRDAGAANHLEYPAGVLYGGTVSAFADRVTLAWGESFLDDRGFQARGTGPFIKFNRTNAGENYGEFWNGIRLASTGTQPVDAAYQALGKFKVGLDFSMMTDASVAVALAQGQRIDFHTEAPINPISGIRRYAETLNDWSLGYFPAAGGITVNAKGAQVGIFRQDFVRFGRSIDNAFAARVRGSSDTAQLAFGQIGATSYITAMTTAAEATGLALRTATSAGTVQTVLHLKTNGTLHAPLTLSYADNAAALAGGRVAGDIYKTPAGELRIVV